MSIAVALVESKIAAGERQVYLSEGAMLRIGGLDYAAVEALHSPAISTALVEEQRLIDKCTALGEELTESLFEAIQDPKLERPVRNALLAVKRDIFNQRLPSADAVAKATGHLPAPFGEAIEEWCVTLDAILHHRRDASGVVAAIREGARQHLRKVIQETDFRLGLLTSSPSLETALVRYGAAPSGKLNRKLRHVEEAVVQFVCRTAYKTSPFSRLTLVSFGWFEEGANIPLVPPLRARVEASVSPNLSLLGRLRHLILLNLTSFPSLEVTIQDQISVSERRLSYRRRVETVLLHPGPIHATAKEFAFSLTRTAALNALVERLVGGRSLQVRELVAVLENADMNVEQATSYLQLLADKGLLKPKGLQTAVLDGDCWRRFAGQLRRAEEPWLQAAAAAVDEVIDGARAYAAGDVDNRRTIIAALESKLDALVQAVDSEARAPRPIVYEDATLARAPLALAREQWDSALADLPRIQRFLAIYDPLLLSRLALKSMFVHRYGRGGTCSDLSAFSDFFHDRFYTAFTARGRKARSFGSGRLNTAYAPELAAVERARALVHEAVAAAAGVGAPVIRLPPKIIDEVGETAASFQDFLSNSVYLQFATVDGRRVVALNRIYGGGGSSFTRFQHLFANPGATGSVHDLLQRNMARISDDDVLMAEFHGGYDTNLNQHLLTTPAEIVFPGERPAGPEAGRIGVNELSLRHDPAKDRVYLYCARLGREVRPVYAGMLYPLALPELQTLLMHFSCPIHLKPDLFTDGDGDGDQFFPQVRCGDIVIERAKWSLSAAALPVRDPTDDDYAVLARYAHWRTSRGLPGRCFAQVFERGNAGSGASQKPFYVDFESPFSIDMIEKANAARTGRVEFSEMLPGPEDAVVFVDGRPRVSEFVVEITQGAQR
jgi:hypothetical protein